MKLATNTNNKLSQSVFCHITGPIKFGITKEQMAARPPELIETVDGSYLPFLAKMVFYAEYLPGEFPEQFPEWACYLSHGHSRDILLERWKNDGTIERVPAMAVYIWEKV